MKKLIWTLLCFALMCAANATAEQQTKFMITISYSPEGQKPLFNYQIFEDAGGTLFYKLSSNHKTISSQKLEWPSNVHDLASALLNDLAKSNATFEPKPTTTKEMRKSIRVALAKGDLEQVSAINGSDQTLSDFIANTHLVRALFGKLSDGNPKMYFLWNEPGPEKAMMPGKIKP